MSVMLLILIPSALRSFIVPASRATIAAPMPRLAPVTIVTGGLRNLGLNLCNRIPVVKDLLVRYALAT